MLDGKKLALVFPGQGSQKVGMGRAWADAAGEARRTFEEADDVLGFALSRLCWEGPEEELGLTTNTQPALLATSIAIYRSLAGHGLSAEPVAMAGHSLGEYSALVAAGALDFADALRLVRQRGQLMQEAVPVGVGAMAAFIGLDDAAVAQLAMDVAEGEVCAVANYNSPGQTVIAGHKAAVDRAVALAKERGARKATLLAVSAPFHSPLMRPAREGMVPALAAVGFHNPRVPVVANVDAAPVATGDAARDALARQIDGPVRWVESVRWMADELGVQAFLEVGSGNVLTGLNRRIATGTVCASLSDPEQLRKLLAGGGDDSKESKEKEA
jgi:[acyl-carrier-protein] S-malonyltransferase